MTETPSTDALPPVRDGLEVAEFGTEYVVWDATCQQVHLLDGLAAVVFDACRQGVSRSEMIAEMIDEAGADPLAARRALDDTLAALSRLGLFHGLSGAAPP